MGGTWPATVGPLEPSESAGALRALGASSRTFHHSRTRTDQNCSTDDVGLKLHLPQVDEQRYSPPPLLALLARADPSAVAD
eukprot:7933460-Pyramimonas_sp.AAC.1